MPEWGAIVRVTLRIAGHVPWRVLDEIMEELSAFSALAGVKGDAISVRLFATAADQAGASDNARMIVPAALYALEIPHDPDSAAVLAVDPIEEFERDFPAPE